MPENLKKTIEASMEDVQKANACPVATKDIRVNIKNRQTCIDQAHYGPLNPELPNTEYWQRKARMFNSDVQQAKSATCSNCAAFIQTPEMLNCIETGLGDEPGNEAYKVMDKANLGFCEIFDFKCAGDRTCDAWVVGGPVTK